MALINRRTKTAARLSRWADDVVAVLTDHFDLDDLTRTTIHTALCRMGGGVPDSTEIIVDSPMSASWRLKADRERRPWGLRIADYRLTQLGQRPPGREVTINADLATISPPG